MVDPYVYPEQSVLRNLLDIDDAKVLDLVEAEQSRANMMLLYDAGFNDFSIQGLQYIHKYLFGDIYDWAGDFRTINIQKREKVLAGASVWYTDVDSIRDELDSLWTTIHRIPWHELCLQEFVRKIVETFPLLWKVHPFREGNTRTIVMMMTFFVEGQGYYVNQDLLAQSAGYVRDAFVLASVNDYAEKEHLERILVDAIQKEPIEYTEDDVESDQSKLQDHSQYTDYESHPVDHEVRVESYDPQKYRT